MTVTEFDCELGEIQQISEFQHLNNYFRLHICLSSHKYFSFPFFLMPAVISQNVSNESCLACAKSEKNCSLGHPQTPWVYEAR